MSLDLQILESVLSTMDTARENVLAGRVRFDAEGHPDPAGVVARSQTAGRGQRGRQWFAQPGECLCATYYLRFVSLTPSGAWPLAFVAGLSVAETIQRVCADAHSISANAERGSAEPGLSIAPRVGLKWPNDLLLNGKKAGGILIELAQPAPDYWVALIGIGININIRDFPHELKLSATSLAREGMPESDWQKLGLQVAASLHVHNSIFLNEGIEAILTRWKQFDETLGRFYETIVDDVMMQGRAEGVETDGALRLRLSDGSVLNVHSASSIKEVTA